MAAEPVLWYILMVTCPLLFLCFEICYSWTYYNYFVWLAMVTACAVPVIYIDGILAVNMLGDLFPGSVADAPGYPYATCLAIWPLAVVTGAPCFPPGPHTAVTLPPGAAILLWSLTFVFVWVPAHLAAKKERTFKIIRQKQEETARKKRIREDRDARLAEIKSDIKRAEGCANYAQREFTLWMGFVQNHQNELAELERRLAAAAIPPGKPDSADTPPPLPKAVPLAKDGPAKAG